MRHTTHAARLRVQRWQPTRAAEPQPRLEGSAMPLIRAIARWLAHVVVEVWDTVAFFIYAYLILQAVGIFASFLR